VLGALRAVIGAQAGTGVGAGVPLRPQAGVVVAADFHVGGHVSSFGGGGHMQKVAQRSLYCKLLRQ
jgi:hypothetical protein